MVTLKTFVFNDFQENTYILSDETKECIIIDPGCFYVTEQNELSDYINKNNLVPKAIINTHGHIDHVLGCKFVQNNYKIPFITHKEELPLIKNALHFGSIFGLKAEQPPLPDSYIDEGEIYRFGNAQLQIFFVPGHSPGSLAFYSAEDKMIITGDVLFRGSIGRTDLPGGNYNMLINVIKNKLLTLPADTMVFPGHGPSSTIGNEINSNPFLI